MKTFGGFLKDERGETGMVLRLVLAVTIAAAVTVILLQLMHVNKDTVQNVTRTFDRGATNALDESMKSITD